MPHAIGFIGLGLMGKPMAANLLKKGFPLVVHSRSPAPVTAAVHALVTALVASGRGPDDYSALATVLFTRAGLDQ